MAKKTFHLDVVSPEGQVYTGEAEMLLVKGSEGDLGITPGHLQLLTSIPPGVAHIHHGGLEELLYVSGGILEVQPEHVTILADVVKRPQDVNEAAALEAKKRAEAALSGKVRPKDFAEVRMELAEALAKLRVIELLRQQKQRR